MTILHIFIEKVVFSIDFVVQRTDSDLTHAIYASCKSGIHNHCCWMDMWDVMANHIYCIMSSSSWLRALMNTKVDNQECHLPLDWGHWWIQRSTTRNVFFLLTEGIDEYKGRLPGMSSVSWVKSSWNSEDSHLEYILLLSEVIITYKYQLSRFSLAWWYHGNKCPNQNIFFFLVLAVQPRLGYLQNGGISQKVV